jgi:hypothetical protein
VRAVAVEHCQPVFEEEYMATNNPILQGRAVGQIPAQRKSWLGRNWKWLLFASFLVMVCFGLGIFALIMSWMRNSDVALEAVARAQANPAVVQRLGARIEEGWLTSGSINVGTGGSGDADLTVPISGPKGNATVYVAARRIAGVWNYSQMSQPGRRLICSPALRNRNRLYRARRRQARKPNPPKTARSRP